jgi:hypothetical protein
MPHKAIFEVTDDDLRAAEEILVRERGLDGSMCLFSRPKSVFRAEWAQAQDTLLSVASDTRQQTKQLVARVKDVKGELAPDLPPGLAD